MSWEAWLTLGVIAIVIALLASERVSAPIAVLGGVTALLLSGVLDAEQAFAGFSSEAPVTIAALYVMAGAAEATGALDRLTALAVGRESASPGQHRPTRRELVRVLAPSAALSTVIYNTPTVALLAPQIAGWARRSGRSPSWYLLALNYAVILGGLATAIGTTTNVVMSGLLTAAGLRPLGLFEITPVGAAVAIIGLLTLLATTPLLARDRESTATAVQPRDFTFEMVVAPRGPLVGSTVSDAGLRALEGVYLVAISRDGTSVAPVPPEEVLVEGDQLIFAGDVQHVFDLQRVVGLTSAEQHHFTGVRGSGATYHQAVVAGGSDLVGSTLKGSDFRARFDAAVVALHRSGERVTEKLGAVRLRSGDVLLVLAGQDFRTRSRGGGDFLVVAPVNTAVPVRRELSRTVGLVFAAFIVLSATGVLSVLKAALLGAFALLALRVLTVAEARRAIDLNVVVTLAASFGLGAAMTASGLAAELAHLIVIVFDGLGAGGVLVAVLVATVAVTQVVTNNAAAIVMFPIALAAARAVHGDVRTFALAVTVGASLCFLTPIAYQTNLMVQGLGGYRFRDFLSAGAVLVTVTTATAAVVLTH